MNIGELADLYDEFYIVEVVQPAKEREKRREIHFEGGNKKNILFLLGNALLASDESKIMLDKLVSNALKLSPEDLVFVALEQNAGITWEELIEQFRPAHMISWGCDSFLQAGKIQVKKYEVATAGAVKLLAVDLPSVYVSDNISKKQLWESIQKLFS